MTRWKGWIVAAAATTMLAAFVAPAGANSGARGGGYTIAKIGTYDTGSGDAAAEIVAFDPFTQQMFVVNGVDDTVDIVDVSDPSAPVLVTQVDLSAYGAEPTSVAVQRRVVAVALRAEPKTDPGKVVFLETDGTVIDAVTVGALPDMVTFSKDASMAFVANEGEPNDEYTVDPEGSLSIISLYKGANVPKAAAPKVGLVLDVATADFNDFDSEWNSLWGAGVRLFGPGASVSQDLEPEYITYDEATGLAVVSLQENNAFAIVDADTAEVIEILPLGTKLHTFEGFGLDPSDRDGAIDIDEWPVAGFFMPDGIASFNRGHRMMAVDGKTMMVPRLFVLSANEGDSRDYEGFSEEARVKDLILDTRWLRRFPDLQDDENLGRLKTTTVDGDWGGDGDHDRIYSFGARSMTVWEIVPRLDAKVAPPNVRLRFMADTGSEFEVNTAAEVPALFNSQGAADSFDERSDDKGPEPESVVIGVVDGRVLAFVGLERIGGFMVYDVTNPRLPTYVEYVPAAAGDISPEGLEFMPARVSPTGNDLLLVANEVSGTVAVYEITLP